MLPKQLSLTDGTIVKLCPTDKPLYCSKQGRFYSLHNAILTAEGWLLHEVKPSFSPRRRRGKWKSSNGISGSQYPTMRHFGNKHCHNLMALTWLGPRPQGMEIDHINGNLFDWSIDNLQYVTPTENRRRAKILRHLRSFGRDSMQFTHVELLTIFSHNTEF